jgi:hypothetical protein
LIERRRARVSQGLEMLSDLFGVAGEFKSALVRRVHRHHDKALTLRGRHCLEPGDFGSKTRRAGRKA